MLSAGCKSRIWNAWSGARVASAGALEVVRTRATGRVAIGPADGSVILTGLKRRADLVPRVEAGISRQSQRHGGGNARQGQSMPRDEAGTRVVVIDKAKDKRIGCARFDPQCPA